MKVEVHKMLQRKREEVKNYKKRQPIKGKRRRKRAKRRRGGAVCTGGRWKKERMTEK